MPLFLFISGYLLDVNKLTRLSFTELIKKYMNRMLMPWLLAWCIYTLIIYHQDLSIKNLIHAFVYPYYHLWYIPTLFSMIVFCYFLKKLIRNTALLYGILITIGIFSLVLPISSIPPFLRLYALAYMVLGCLCRNHLHRIIRGGDILSYLHLFCYHLVICLLRFLFMKDIKV